MRERQLIALVLVTIPRLGFVATHIAWDVEKCENQNLVAAFLTHTRKRSQFRRCWMLPPWWSNIVFFFFFLLLRLLLSCIVTAFLVPPSEGIDDQLLELDIVLVANGTFILFTGRSLSRAL